MYQVVYRCRFRAIFFVLAALQFFMQGNAAPKGLEASAPQDSLLNCIPPKDSFLFCTDPLVQTLQFNSAPAVPGPNYSLSTLPAKKEFSSACGYGTITRSWQLVRDKGTPQETTGPVCTQRLEIRPLTRYVLRFPADTTLLCSEVGKADTVFYRIPGCDVLSVTYTDEKLKVPGQNCFVIYRTHRVINWCEFTGNTGAVLLERDADRDGKTGDEPLWVLVEPAGQVYLDRDSIFNNAVPSAKGHWTSSTETPALRSKGYWEYQQIIRIIDNFAPVLSVASFVEVPARRADCTADINLPLNVEEACTPESLDFSVTWDRFNDGFPDGDISNAIIGTYPRFRLIYRMPFGKHSLSIRVRDKCGNETERIVNIQVTDGRPPAPRCINSLVVPLAPLPPNTDADGDGTPDRAALSLNASDLLSSSQLADCSGPLKYSVHKAELIESGTERPSPGRNTITLTCDDRPTELLYVYAWDASGNSGFCETYILLQDAANLCPELGEGSIAGMVQSPSGNPIEGAKVLLKAEKVNQTFSNREGRFLFEFLKENQDYTLSAEVDSSYKDGVTTYDIVMIMRHILGEEPFHSPFQYLAADADLSGTISTLDVIHIRKLVLHLENALPHKKQFRYFPTNYAFPSPTDALRANFPENLNFPDLKGKFLNAGITVVKIGDVTGDAFSTAPSPTVIIQQE